MHRLLLQILVEGLVGLLICALGFEIWQFYTNQDGNGHLDHMHEPEHPFWSSEPVYMPPEKETKYPIILWWIPYSRTPRLIKTCKVGTCLFTHSRTEINNSLTKNVIFYGTGLQWNNLPLPRNPNQTWSLLHEESPKNAWKFTVPEAISLFNYTATCSRFSSFSLVSLSLSSLKPILAPMKTPVHLKSKGEYSLVMYLHSDCDAMSDRDSYVSKLMNIIPIDSYGHCLHNKDLPNHLKDPRGDKIEATEILELMSKYKFILTFENAICDDYITEKFWRIFEAGSVPVYRGSPSISDWAPNDHSVINIDEFISPEHLAQYLLHLNDNPEEYNSYLEYKKEGITNTRLLEHMKHRGWALEDPTNRMPNFIQAFECHVCDNIHKREQALREGKQVKPVIADTSHYSCPSLRPSLQLMSTSQLVGYQGREKMKLWKHHVMCEELKAKAVSRLIKNGAGNETVNTILEQISQECASVEYSEEWLLNAYDHSKNVHTPVSIGMCKDLE